MILEVADIRIAPGKQAEFDAAIRHGVETVIARASGFCGYKVNRGVESPEARGQGLTAQKLHDDIGSLVVELAVIENLYQPQVVDSGNGSGFMAKSLDGIITIILEAYELNSYQSFCLYMFCFIDDAHSSLTDDSDDSILINQ